MERLLTESVAEINPNVALATICMIGLFASVGVGAIIMMINKAISNASKLR
jgi:hypothetical protein